ncbi:CBS-domain-containing membrane protein [Wenyingzhuangia heitensis]|uniref:CBS-domain-containing membrane protein n=1 Tax=Wenyingzhuangia heitensis TaxID=1487859 RepID=A0ABX0UAE5_9FLAO|nr:HPP family protein [Wenyingzhuangia heitensis]NIJ44541.1 CBS-domain-containing membrane protein [Wenyingzhuangia heitensis]
MKKQFNKSLRITKYVIYKETFVDKKEHFWSFVGSFVGIACIAFIQTFYLDKTASIFLIGSFGASSVLVYGAIYSPLAQPRNLIGGHVISALIGVCVYKTVGDIFWLAAPLAVSLSIVAMQITKTLHPPGGATALIAIIGSKKIISLGFFYVLSPVLSGCLILLFTALLFNNITKNRVYPKQSKFIKRIRNID